MTSPTHRSLRSVVAEVVLGPQPPPRPGGSSRRTGAAVALGAAAIAAALVVALLAGAFPARAAELEEVKARGVLRHLGVPYANFVTGAGDGMDVDLIRLFAASLGVRYEYVETDWGTAIPDLVGPSPRGDVLANGVTRLPWREKLVRFSEPTFPSQIWLVARAASPLRPIVPSGDVREDVARTRALLKGHGVLTVRKTCLDPDLYDLAGAGAKVVVFGGKLNEVAPALLNGEAELTILDVPDALIALEKWRGQLKVLGPITDRQLMATAFAPETPRLREAYAAFLARVQQDGTYLRLVRRYYPTAAGNFPAFFSAMK